MKPILQAAIMTVRYEPVGDGEVDQDFDSVVQTVLWQVNCVLQENGKSVYEHFQRFFHSM